ncbi:alpha/beta fold hydrolase [Xylophilus sp. Kf1]|nr:alpha/beta fold hydrolase [Xylophilus sp. Kf1]
MPTLPHHPPHPPSGPPGHPPFLQPFQLPFEDVVLRGATLGAGPGRPPTVMSLHGGGTARHTGVHPLLRPLAEAGWPAVGFDFSGHGDSGGSVEGSGLRQRSAQARAVAAHLALRPPLALVGTSMGGHIACRLIPHFRPRALLLFCPAAYSAEAESVPFGPAFGAVLRATTDFAASPAFDDLENFEGRLLLVYGEEDSVIPPAVQHQYAERARRARSVERLRLPGAPHRLHGWLAEDAQAEVRRRLVARMLATLAD